MAAHLTAGDLPAARGALPALAGRDPAGLGEPELARATVESVAENTSDAAVAPLFWGAVAGIPGLLGYRAVNTLDAMVGPPLAAVRAVRLGRRAAGRRRQLAARPAHRRADGRLRPGWPAARPAGALARLAAGRRRAPQPERRPLRGRAGRRARACGWAAATSTAAGSRSGRSLGDGQPPVRGDIRRAVRLSRAVWTAAAVLAAAARRPPAGAEPAVGARPRGAGSTGKPAGSTRRWLAGGSAGPAPTADRDDERGTGERGHARSRNRTRSTPPEVMTGQWHGPRWTEAVHFGMVDACHRSSSSPPAARAGHPDRPGRGACPGPRYAGLARRIRDW